MLYSHQHDINLYEFPLHERIRNFMRIEDYFAQIDYFCKRDNIWDSQASLKTMIELLTFIERVDLRSEILKELDRRITNLQSLANKQFIDHNKLQDLIQELKAQIIIMQNTSGRIVQYLTDYEILNTIKQKVTINQQTNNFDIFRHYFWLHQPLDIKRQQMQTWTQALAHIRNSINLIMMLIREGTNFTQQTANQGVYQQSFEKKYNCHMVRIKIQDHSNQNTIFPEVSGNNRRMTVRLLQYIDNFTKPKQISLDTPFFICCCIN